MLSPFWTSLSDIPLLRIYVILHVMRPDLEKREAGEHLANEKLSTRRLSSLSTSSSAFSVSVCSFPPLTLLLSILSLRLLLLGISF